MGCTIVSCDQPIQWGENGFVSSDFSACCVDGSLYALKKKVWCSGEELAVLLLGGDSPQECAGNDLLGSWNLTHSSLCAAESRVTKGTEVGEMSRSSSVPHWSSHGKLLCHMLLKIWEG